jgi:hypothetical protein
MRSTEATRVGPAAAVALAGAASSTAAAAATRAAENFTVAKAMTMATRYQVGAEFRSLSRECEHKHATTPAPAPLSAARGSQPHGPS